MNRGNKSSWPRSVNKCSVHCSQQLRGRVAWNLIKAPSWHFIHVIKAPSWHFIRNDFLLFLRLAKRKIPIELSNEPNFSVIFAGCRENTDPQSMDYPDGLPKWTTPKMYYPPKILFQMSTIERTAIYILTLHVPCLISSARPLAAILNNYTLWTTAERKKCRLMRRGLDSGKTFIIKNLFPS